VRTINDDGPSRVSSNPGDAVGDKHRRRLCDRQASLLLK
jgi:hypothetical protein